MQARSEPASSPTEREFHFGAFRFIPARQLLLHEGQPVRVGARALDILLTLLERPGELVSKRELIARVWPVNVVEESNLKVHVAALRRALGDVDPERSHIVTTSGRGYSFVTPVSTGPDDGRGIVPAAALPTRYLSPPLTRTIGREEVVAALVEALAPRRLLTVVGPGGIGKTTVAVETAAAFASETGVEVCFVDLSRISSGEFTAGTVATALGLTIHSGDPVQAVLTWLRPRRHLLVLDSCENVIDSAADLVQCIATEAPGTVLLATSREPLRISGEQVHHLAPLNYPVDDVPLRATEALQYAAVQLFVERAADSCAGYRLSDADAPAVAEICRRLQGIALAIELAATRIDAFGAIELAARLDDRFRLLKRGRRGAQIRHRTLAAALDWSYEFLPESERKILRGLGVFADAFTIDAATAVLSSPELDTAAIIDGVGNLVAKSLLVADLGGAGAVYRLLDTTRAYALEKLDASDETSVLRRRHAEFVLAWLRRAGEDGRFAGGAGPKSEQSRWLEDVRGALGWAYAASGDIPLGIKLTVTAIPLWMHLSLVDECRQATLRALAAGDGEHQPAPADLMKLYAAHAGATLHTRGPLDEAGDAWIRALELAEGLGDDEYQLRALWGLGMHRGYVGEFRSVLLLAERFRAIAVRIGDRAASASVERLVGTAYHSLGEEPAARRHLELMLERTEIAAHDRHIARFQVDQRIATLSVLGNVLWVLGYPDQAKRTMEEAVRNARLSGHALSLLGALANAACLAVRSCADEAESLLGELGELLSRNAIAVLDGMRRSLLALLDLRSGHLASAADIYAALDEMRRTGFQYRYSIYMGMLAEALGRNGRRTEALELIGQALAFAEGRDEGWCLAELWRIKGELLAKDAAPAAEQCFAQALEVSARQQARLWSLRAAASLVRLDRQRGRSGAGLATLADVFASFDEGFDSADLQQARQLMDGGIA